jgi:hypothetical protein
MHSGTSFGEKFERERAFTLMMASYKNSEVEDQDGLLNSGYEPNRMKLSIMGSEVIQEDVDGEEQIGLFFEDDQRIE